MVLAIDGYLRRRAWLAWHSGLVANGNITDFDELLPEAGAADASGRGVQSEVQMAHNMSMWRQIFGLKAERVEIDADA